MNNYYKVKKSGGYDSKFERTIAQELELRVKAGELKSFDEQVKIPLIVEGYKVCDYKIDFVAYRTDGVTEYIEAKGFPTQVFKIKWKLFEALYGNKEKTELIIIWQGKQMKFKRTKNFY
jgi:hypothetical protein